MKNLIATSLVALLAGTVATGCTKKSPEQQKAEIQKEANQDIAERKDEAAKDVSEEKKDVAEETREASKDVAEEKKDVAEVQTDAAEDVAEIKKDAQEEVAEVNADTRENKADTVGAAGGRGAEDNKEAFAKTYEQRIDALEDEVEKLEDTLDKKSDQVKEGAKPVIADVKAKHDAAETQVKSLKDADAASWTNMKAQVENSVKELESAVARAKSHVESH